jgi:lysophospholipase L1-like esterase
MIDCMIIGDSIAVGTAQQRTECVSQSKGGINSHMWNNKYANKDLQARSVIISLGTNDHDGVHTFRELQALRSRVDAERVYWIMPPIKPHVQDIVEIIARSRGDVIIRTSKLSADGIHPTGAGYKELANQTR